MPNRRAKLELVTPTASPEQAAAVIAAVERFLRDRAPTAAPPPPPAASHWARAARLEGVREQSGRFPWGDPHPWV